MLRSTETHALCAKFSGISIRLYTCSTGVTGMGSPAAALAAPLAAGLAAAPLRHMLCVPLFLAGVFDFEELHMLNRDHLNYEYT